MCAIVEVGEDWYGFIYPWSDSKKKSALILSIMEPGTENVPWLGTIYYLNTIICILYLTELNHHKWFRSMKLIKILSDFLKYYPVFAPENVILFTGSISRLGPSTELNETVNSPFPVKSDR